MSSARREVGREMNRPRKTHLPLLPCPLYHDPKHAEMTYVNCSAHEFCTGEVSLTCSSSRFLLRGFSGLWFSLMCSGATCSTTSPSWSSPAVHKLIAACLGGVTNAPESSYINRVSLSSCKLSKQTAKQIIWQRIS